MSYYYVFLKCVFIYDLLFIALSIFFDELRPLSTVVQCVYNVRESQAASAAESWSCDCLRATSSAMCLSDSCLGHADDVASSSSSSSAAAAASNQPHDGRVMDSDVKYINQGTLLPIYDME